MTSIRVRVNPADGNYVIYADPEDPPTPWMGQTVDGRYLGWFQNREVADWREHTLEIPSPGDTAQEATTTACHTESS